MAKKKGTLRVLRVSAAAVGERLSARLPPRFRPFWERNWQLIIILATFFLFLFFFIFKDLPSPTKLGGEFPVSTQIFDRNGTLLYEIYAEQNRTPISMEELPEYVRESTIAIEDKDFYRHRGYDPTGMLRAVYNIVFRRRLQGGSTITQQLVKNALLSPERTIRRKVREFLLSLATETIYSKDQILEMYLNQVPYGGTAWGVEAAARNYFDKSARNLTLAEAALLAGLPAAPTRFSPFGARPELAKTRQEAVLRRMVEDGYISQEEAAAAAAEELVFRPQSPGIRAPHFVLYVKELLVEKHGQRMVEQGGLRVTTTLDINLQEFTQETVATEAARLKNLNVGNGAALVTNPATGEILAMVGSKDYFATDEDGNVNVTLRPRQPGSAIKPVNYALAFDKHLLTPASLILDVPSCFAVFGQPLYCPVNYDGQSRGPIQARFALGNSINVAAVKVLALNGLEDFVATASAMGIETFTDPSDFGLSITLGGGEVKMVDMATAMGTLANLGIRQDLVSILKVEDYKGNLLEETKIKDGPRVVSMEAAYLVYHILLDNNARGEVFGPSSYLVVGGHPEVAVKTGTTNDKRDNWTVGWTPSYLVAVWVGNNDNTPMSAVASGVTGASPIWNRIMTHTLEGDDQEWPLRPEGVVGAQVCAMTGLSPGDSGCQTRFEYFIEGTVPDEVERLRRQIWVNRETGRQVFPAELAANPELANILELREQTVVGDFFTPEYCLDCVPPEKPLVINPAAPLPTPGPEPVTGE